MNRFVIVNRSSEERSRRACLLPIDWARSKSGSCRPTTQVQRCGRWLHRILLGLLFLGFLLPQPLWSQTSSPLATSSALNHSASPTATLTAEQLAQQAIADQVTRVFETMSAADRVGQLFVITFDGNQIAPNSDIVKLIRQERIGGVVLSPAKHNFTNTKGENTPVAVAQLINQLQALTYGYLVSSEQALSLPLTSSFPFSGSIPLSSSFPAPAVPLLIGVEQQGDGYPATALRRGFTTLPSQMALGATWDPTLVQAVGKIVGQELQAVGVNLLLGPNLDVVDEPRNDPVGALGLYSFGGNPYWVSQLGRAYITGVHEGSSNGVATIARHFPGQGDIDRFPDKEVATVQKNLNDLRTVALPPFTQVTRQVSPILSLAGDLAATDGLMTSHMRFSAWQGVTSGRTIPMSLNPDLKMLLNDEGLGDWYDAGGIMMTNGLGLPAIRRYYEATLNEFAYKRVVLDAFTAGHDLLYLTHLSNDGAWETEKQYLQEILEFFRERYKKEADFRVQVDHAVQRILRLKWGLYQNQRPLQQNSGEERTPTVTPLMLVPPGQVLRQRADLALFTENSPHRTEASNILSQVTRAAITLLYPNVENLSDVIATPPQANDQLLIFSDSRLFSECEGCVAETALGPEELKSIITRLYGTEPGATGQISPTHVYGRSFIELGALLDAADAEGAAGLTATNALTPVTATQALTNVPSLSTPVNDALADDGRVATEELLTANERLQRLINESNWIIFAMLDVDPSNKSGSDVVKRFLRQQSEQLGNKQVIVLALNAPYFLDATEISKLTAYFGVYSKTQPFLESAIRAIFRSAAAPGAPPVSVPGTRFNNLNDQLQPDPLNPLHLTIYLGETELSLPTGAQGTEPLINMGDTLRVEVSHILDHNGHSVPDGTKVELQLVYEGRDMTIPVGPTVTRNGSATQMITVEQPGRLLLSASAGEAKMSAPVTVRIQDPAAVNTTASVTTTAAAGTQGANSVTATLPLTEAGMPTLPGEADLTIERGVNVTTLVIAFLTILVTLSLLLILQIRILPRAMLVQNMLWAAIFGLSAYILYGLQIIPGIFFLQDTLRVWGAAVVVFISMLLPLLWLQLRAE